MIIVARTILGSFLSALLLTTALAADVTVLPGKDTLARAIETAAPGDRLLLSAGDYTGGMSIDKPLKIIGDGDAHVRGTGFGSVLRIVAENVTISGLLLTGSGSDHETIDSGIQLTKKAANAIIRDNHIEGNLYGVDIHGASNARVEGNTIIGQQDKRMNRRGNGVYVWNAPGASVDNNIIRFGRDGIFVNSSKKNSFRNNRFQDLRFAVHYMYADDSEISGNVSIGNHLGYAIMFTSRLKIIGNTSINDREHGIMLNYANEALVENNTVVDGGKKCLFMYNANKNTMRNNHFEGCPIGIHFTAGSDRNEISGNSFVGNRTQVKYVGTKDHTWRGNYWSDHPSFDVNGDGVADQAFRPNDTMDEILWTQPAAKLLLGSPAVQLIRWAQKNFPSLLPGGVVDPEPRMAPNFTPAIANNTTNGE